MEDIDDHSKTQNKEKKSSTEELQVAVGAAVRKRILNFF